MAVAMMTPPVLLGAFANMLLAMHLADLSVVPGISGDVAAAQAAFRDEVHIVDITLFVMFGILTFASLHFTEDAMRGLHGFALVVLLLVCGVVYGSWTFGIADTQTLQIGLGITFWGLGWVLIMVQMFSLLRATPHRKWTWVTGGVGLYQAAMFFLALELGIYASARTAALVFMMVGSVSTIVFSAHRDLVGTLWGYGRRNKVRLPDISWKGALLVVIYSVVVFGMIGAEYVHHFAYEPVWGRQHYVLLAATTPIGVVLFGTISERGGRRALLYAVPIAIAFALLFQEVLNAIWPLVIAEGIMLGSLPYLFQYLAEATQVLTRGTVFLFSLGAVAIMGFGGTFNQQFTEFVPVDPASRVLLEFAGLLVAVALAPQLPETRARVTDEQELEDYLELARRVGSERSRG